MTDSFTLIDLRGFIYIKSDVQTHTYTHIRLYYIENTGENYDMKI